MIRKIISLVAIGGIIITLKAAEVDTVDETKKIGGSGCIGIGVMNLDLDPLKEVVEDGLNREGFKFNDNRFMTVSFLGYSGPRRNGFRIGGTGTFGYNTLYSNSWKGIVIDSAYVTSHPDSLMDSVVQLHNILAFGGLVMEKSFSLPANFSLFFGGMLGAGALVSIADYKEADDAFSDIWDNDDNSEITINNDEIVVKDGNSNDTMHHSEDKVAVAPLWAFDLHGGATYSLTKWMHVGLDASVTVFYSSNGFSYRQGSFMTANPALKLRLIFGNAV
ncbi:MAG TPA: hypothetical protein VHO70_00580 [Chitinispirillaceae bacterium]|nr:hypothetical protein [Chitinispirillaceae bacterium]